MTFSDRLEAFEKRITELEAENKRLHDTVAYLTKQLFGKRSEKTSSLSEGQVSLFDELPPVFNEAETLADSQVAEPDLQQEAAKFAQKRYKGQRKDQVNHLEHVKKVYHLTNAERSCKTCDTELAVVGEEFVRSELEFVPAQVRVIDYYRETLECRTCRKDDKPYMKKAELPDPVILHSLASPSTLAWIMHQKFVNAIPLYRQEAEWQSLGVSLSRATMSNWLMVAARDWLLPVTERLRQELLKERYLHVDETPIQVLQEEGRKNTTESYMWVYSTGQYGEHPIRLFEYQPGRGGKYPQKFLKGFQGFLHTDAYAGYDKVENIIRCYCWAHVRRRFVDALPKDVQSTEATIAAQGIQCCNQLFEMEKNLRDLPADKRHNERLTKQMPMVEAFWSWAKSSSQRIMPKCKTSEALLYALKYKEGLMNYLQDGNCSISNNLAENSIRPFTIGRKNWLFSGSPKGAAASAAIYSLVETAKVNGLSPHHYLAHILGDLPGLPFRQYPEILDNYLPWHSEVQKTCASSKTGK
jgi:transposase